MKHATGGRVTSAAGGTAVDGLVALPIDGETEMGWDDSVVPSMKGLKLQIEITDLPLTEKNRSR